MPDSTTAHAEVWDDSALLASWNEAFEEYQKYHSIAARGETVRLTPHPAEPKPAVSNGADHTSKEDQDSAPSAVNTTQNRLNENVPIATPVNLPAATVIPATLEGTLAVPKALMSSMQNEELKNLMMSWYYSGYYTGLYEGKQQGYAMAKGEESGG